MQSNPHTKNGQDTKVTSEIDSSAIQQEAANEPIEKGTTEPEGGSFEDIEREAGMANAEPEAEDFEKEAYINTDLVSEEDINQARESLVDEEHMPDSPLSDPTQRDNN